MTSWSPRRQITLRPREESTAGRSRRMEFCYPSKAGCRRGPRVSLTPVALTQADRPSRLLTEVATCMSRTISGRPGHAAAPDCRPRAAFSSVEQASISVHASLDDAISVNTCHTRHCSIVKKVELAWKTASRSLDVQQNHVRHVVCVRPGQGT